MIQVETLDQSFRRLVAKRNISKGELILQKQPLYFSVISSKRKQYCNNCFQLKSNLSTCTACGVLFYCSKQCQIQDWKQHKLECKIYKRISQKGFKMTSDFHLLMRIFMSKDQLSSFISNRDCYGEEKIKFFTEQSITLLKNLEIEVTQADIDFLINSQAKMATNALTIQDALFESDGIGIGLYQEVNYMNHSCSPNVICIFENSTEVKVVAIKDIKAGQEICNSYTDTRNLMEDRQSFLKENYFFNCECQRCKLEKSEGIAFLRCSECKEGRINSISFQCTSSSCSQNTSSKQETIEDEKNKKQIDNLTQYTQKVKRMKSIDKECSSSDFNKIIQLIKEAESICYQDAPWFSSIYNYQIIAALGEEKYELSLKLLTNYIDLHELWYSKVIGNEIDLPFLGWKYNEFSKLAFHLDDVIKAEEFSEKALKILSKFYSKEKCSELNELYLRLGDIKSEIKMKFS